LERRIARHQKPVGSPNSPARRAAHRREDHRANPWEIVPMTGKPAWTPGPWNVIESELGTIRIKARRGFIAILDERDSGEEDAANARLIAAALGLYEALDEAINYLAIYALWRLGDEKAKEILNKCTTALAKARGEQP
jgi:hypothetical protein